MFAENFAQYGSTSRPRCWPPGRIRRRPRSAAVSRARPRARRGFCRSPPLLVPYRLRRATHGPDRIAALRLVVLVKQVPDTANVTGEAMKEDGTVNRAALPTVFNPEDLNALEEALQAQGPPRRRA